MPEDEYEKLRASYKNTIYRSISEYVRHLLLALPLTVIYRNRSLDDLIETAVLLRRDMRALLLKDSFTDIEKEKLNQKITNLEELIIKTIEQCSQ